MASEEWPVWARIFRAEKAACAAEFAKPSGPRATTRRRGLLRSHRRRGSRGHAARCNRCLVRCSCSAADWLRRMTPMGRSSRLRASSLHPSCALAFRISRTAEKVLPSLAISSFLHLRATSRAGGMVRFPLAGLSSDVLDVGASLPLACLQGAALQLLGEPTHLGVCETNGALRYNIVV